MIDIVEAKEVGILYHFTNIFGLIKIISSNKMEGNWHSGYVSFTRNRNFSRTYRKIGVDTINVRIIIDGNKLSEKYKIEPYSYYGNQGKSDYRYGSYDESEEHVKGDITNISEYIIEAEILSKHDLTFLDGEEFRGYLPAEYNGKDYSSHNYGRIYEIPIEDAINDFAKKHGIKLVIYND
jgi:hypothetical protein